MKRTRTLLMLIILILMISATASAQSFSVSSMGGYAFKFKEAEEPNLFNLNIQLEEQFNFDGIFVSGIQLGLSDSTSEFFAGLKAGYEIWNTSNKTISLSGSALKDLYGSTMFGGGLSYTTGGFIVATDFYYNDKKKYSLLNLSFGTSLIY